MPKAWLRDRQREYYYRRAKEEGYRSRASFKLLQAIKKYRFMKKKDVVVDLGAAPGGWLQVTRDVIGEDGFVLGIDIKSIAPFKVKNIYLMIADVKDPKILLKINQILPSFADVLISDVAPNVSGVWEVDHARQIQLATVSLFIAQRIVKRGGNFFVKVFQGDMLNDFLSDVKKKFSTVRIVKPKASRDRSSEVFILGIGLKKGNDNS